MQGDIYNLGALAGWLGWGETPCPLGLGASPAPLRLEQGPGAGWGHRGERAGNAVAKISPLGPWWKGMGRNQRGPRGCSPARGECSQGGDVAELGPHRAALGQGQGGWGQTLCGGTRWWNKRQQHKSQLGMFRGPGDAAALGWVSRMWGVSILGDGRAPQDTAAAIPIACQRWPCPSGDKGLWCCLMEPDLPSGSWLLPQHPLMQRGSLMRGGGGSPSPNWGTAAAPRPSGLAALVLSCRVWLKV